MTATRHERSEQKVPSSPRYLRLFAVSLLVVVACLLGLLFGVQMEATVTAQGVIKARDQFDCRAPLTGLAEPGWFEGTLHLPGETAVPFRIDQAGNGITLPASGKPQLIRRHQLSSGISVKELPARFHKLAAGDIVHAGQPLVRLHCEPWRFLHLALPQERLPAQWRQEMEENASVLVPGDHARWLVLNVSVERGAAVRAGDVLASLAPLDPATGQPANLIADVQIEERFCDEVKPGLAVRLYSSMFHHRLHGHAEGELERLDPWGEPGNGNERRFRALVRVTSSPFTFRLGSSVKADIILGRKHVYRIILEH